jgi:hypothetical protein
VEAQRGALAHGKALVRANDQERHPFPPSRRPNAVPGSVYATES